MPGELGGGASALGRAQLCGRRRACSGVQPFGGSVSCGGLGGVLLGFVEFGDGFGERGQPRDEHDRGHGPVAGQEPFYHHHHRCKQAEGWQLEQPEPGVLVWRTPAGRTYATTPTAYPI